MSDIKSVIAILCKQLKLLYGSDIRNEHFRLAKFNETKEDTVVHFWQLLSELLKEDDELNIVFNDDNITNFVKLNLCHLKYNSLPFYSLPSDMSCGSRELLLAFGWLIASRNLLEKTTYKKLLHSSISKEFGDICPTDMSEHLPDKGTVKNVRDACNLALWYAGKIRHNINNIAEMSSELTTIMTKVHEDTLLTCGLPHLSVGDAKLIYDIEKSKECNDPPPDMEGLKESISITDTLKHWHRKEDLFWEWMESVVREREKTQSSWLNIERKQALTNFVETLKRNIEMLVREMKKASDSGLNVSRLFQKDPAEFYGLPRFIFREHCDDHTIKTIIEDTSREISEMEKKIEEQLVVAKSALSDLSDKIPEVRIINT